ncbi:MAG: hypothetical protein KC561_10040 [Myxococcales bacterium]|nr:hypothetical protein [Myxococcales bacterium]
MRIVTNNSTRLLLALCFCLAGTQAAWAEDTGLTFGYFGMLADESGTPINRDLQVIAELYDAPRDGNILYSEQLEVTVINGAFSVNIGTDGGLQADDLVGSFLQLTIANEVLEPRTRVAPAAIAQTSINSLNRDGLVVGATQFVDDSGDWVGPVPVDTALTDRVDLLTSTVADGVEATRRIDDAVAALRASDESINTAIANEAAELRAAINTQKSELLAELAQVEETVSGEISEYLDGLAIVEDRTNNLNRLFSNLNDTVAADGRRLDIVSTNVSAQGAAMINLRAEFEDQLSETEVTMSELEETQERLSELETNHELVANQANQIGSLRSAIDANTSGIMGIQDSMDAARDSMLEALNAMNANMAQRIELIPIGSLAAQLEETNQLVASQQQVSQQLQSSLSSLQTTSSQSIGQLKQLGISIEDLEGEVTTIKTRLGM